jgi:hypothetical protein
MRVMEGGAGTMEEQMIVLEWRDGGPVPEWPEWDGTAALVAGDGESLVVKERFAEIAGVTVGTITWRLSDSRRQVRAGHSTRFPSPYSYVWRNTVKGDGERLRVLTPVWREGRARTWAATRLGPGGHPRIGQRAG